MATTVVQSTRNEILDIVYPVGSIYISVNNVSPEIFIGGGWEAFGSGKTLIGVDSNDTDFATVESTGGEKKHTLTTNEMPSHNHYSGQVSGYYMVHGNGNGGGAYGYHLSTGSAGSWKAIVTTYTGGGNAHNILQPYVTVYMWKRVS